MNKFFKKEVKKISVIFQKDETLGASHVNTPKEGPIKVLKSRPTPEICWHRTWHIEKYLINVCSVTEWVNWLVPVKCLKNLCMNLTLCDSMNHSTPGLPVHHHLPEFTQTHIHRAHDAIQPSHPRSSPIPHSIRVFSNELFSWGGQSTGASALASFLPKKSQGWSPSEWTGWIFLQSEVLSNMYTVM